MRPQGQGIREPYQKSFYHCGSFLVSLEPHDDDGLSFAFSLYTVARSFDGGNARKRKKERQKTITKLYYPLLKPSTFNGWKLMKTHPFEVCWRRRGLERDKVTKGNNLKKCILLKKRLLMHFCRFFHSGPCSCGMSLWALLQQASREGVCRSQLFFTYSWQGIKKIQLSHSLSFLWGITWKTKHNAS